MHHAGIFYCGASTKGVEKTMSEEPTPIVSDSFSDRQSRFSLTLDWWAVIAALVLVGIVLSGILGPILW